MRTRIEVIRGSGAVLSALLLLASTLLLASPAAAVPMFCGGVNQICYDDVLGPLIDFTDINETVQTADDAPATANDGLYGAPTGGANTLNFFPNSFDATSGAGSGLDTTHATLNLTIMTNQPDMAPIDSILITEFGDYTFAGFAGTTDTGVQGTLGGQITVLEAGGAPIAPVVFNIDGVDGVLTVVTGGTVIPGGHEDDIVAAGGGTVTWSIDYFLDLAGLNASKVEIQLNNILVANSEAATSATIQKKVSLVVVPEPGTFSLLALGVLGLALRRR